MKILGWIVAIPLIVFGLFALARFLVCGPDKEVVRVATPMVQGIADYIVKHGVPESLADIEGLPYELEGCERKKTYYKYLVTETIVVKDSSQATSKLFQERCKINNTIYLNFWFSEDCIQKSVSHGSIQASSAYTRVGTGLKVNATGSLFYQTIGAKAVHHGFICSAFKQ